MNILIVGASGFLGSVTYEAAQRAGHNVLGTRATRPREGLVEFDLLRHRITECVPDGFLESPEPVSAVICACICQIDRCAREQSVSRAVNVERTIQLLDDLVAQDVRPVFISTGYVFDGTQGYYRETDLRAPICEYGRQKAVVEDYILQNIPHAAILRLDKPVADTPQGNHLFSQWNACVQQQQPIACIAGQVFAPTLVDDIAEALVATCRTGLRGLYHVANREYFERAELARQFVRAAGVAVPVVAKPLEEFPFADARPLKTYLDSSRFVAETGMQFTSMSDVFTRYFERRAV